MSAECWTYATRGRKDDLERAEVILPRCWEMRDVATPITQCDIANNLAVLCVRQQRYSEALHWLNQQEELLANTNASIEGRLKQRASAHIPYYRGQVSYALEKYGEAKRQFLQMVEIGQRIGWQRAVIYAQNWLADIAIVQRQFEEAERLIHLGLPVAERNNDLRRTALFKRSYARLEHACGNESEAHRWATEALDLFERLGMQQEIDEVELFIEQLGD
jgi:tetratricopeptide (TPR) repeat protein